MKGASTKKKTASSKAAKRTKPRGTKAAPRRPVARRADFGAPVEGFFAKQPPALRAILDALRELVQQAAPDASASLKWGMASYAIDGSMMCVLAAHKAHVNLVISGPPGAFADPDGLLVGSGKTGRHLTLRNLADLPRVAVRGWLRTAARLAREKS